MTNLREAAQQALEALEWHLERGAYGADIEGVTGNLRDALAQQAEPVQEPVAWSFEARHIDTAWGSAVSLKHPGREHKYMRNVKPLYLAPPQRKPLTEEEIDRICASLGFAAISPAEIVRAVERAHGIGETK